MILTIPEGPFEGYIFDCDGTLVDSMPLHFLAWRASFEHHEAPWDWTEDLFYASAGIPDREIVRDLNEKWGTAIPAESVHEFKLQWYFQRMNALKPVEAVAEQVRFCHRSGRPISVASGSDRSLVVSSLEHTSLRHFFEIIITPIDVKRGKPAPDMFLLAAERMGIEPAKCLVFEDGQAGITAATAAGMQSVFVDSRRG